MKKFILGMMLVIGLVFVNVDTANAWGTDFAYVSGYGTLQYVIGNSYEDVLLGLVYYSKGSINIHPSVISHQPWRCNPNLSPNVKQMMRKNKATFSLTFTAEDTIIINKFENGVYYYNLVELR